MSYVFLFAAILFEVMGTTCMKLSEGFTKTLPSIMIFVFYGVSFTLFTLALKRLEVSLAYAIWSGIGTLSITAIGIFYFDETLTALKVGSIALIVIGVIGLNLSSGIN
ncbi:multidrug efflux SMR transporter [Methanococcoides orientis]|uniref:DMT family transporter n=1 Tax=Methanococcoides orientis TaxID=2822137 RepID=UPI001E61D898|nr:multidrug efflux SMR transporter [Methanococcoides orientis]UGV41491.1 multidrug efflux SMR transporter [Methanococcoides orientis]